MSTTAPSNSTAPQTPQPSVQTPNATGGSLGSNPFAQAATGGTTNTNPTSTTGQQIVAPAAAVSPYEFQNVEGARVILGPELAQILGLPANTAVTGGQILQQYYDAPAAAINDLGEMLYAAGMYANTAGEPTTQRPVFAKNIDTFNALAQLILQAGNTNLKTTASQVLAASTASGAGFANQQNALQPQLGGGNTYQINLTNPQDIYQMTNQVFQSALGRNPTQQEYQSVLADVQKGQESQQQLTINQAESMSQAKYQQAITSRTAENTPAAVTGNVPNGPFTSAEEEAVAILQYGAYAVNPNTVAFLTAWIEQNGGVSNNPLGVAGAQGTQAAQGIQMAVNLLHSPQYQALNATLTNTQSNAASFKTGAVQSELSQWSGGAIKSLDTKPYIGKATDAVLQYGSTQQAGSAANAPPPGDAARTAGITAPGAQMIAARENSQPGNQLASSLATAQAPGGVTGQQASPTSQAASQVGQTGQGMAAPGDNYLPSTTITDQQAASPDAAAFYAATTGANTTPYYANQAQAGLQAIINLIQQGPEKL